MRAALDMCPGFELLDLPPQLAKLVSGAVVGSAAEVILSGFTGPDELGGCYD